eukprot:7391746-Prymnesium_polylepis.1
MRFLWVIRPAFAKMITPRTFMSDLANDLLDEAYEETKQISTAALNAVPGRPTLGMDGHKEGKHRHVETITQAKLGISTFAGAEYMGTTRTSGKNLATVAFKYLNPCFIALVADNTGNNTGENTGLFACVLAVFTTLFCLGCGVHVLDLLIEDIAKLPLIKSVGEDAHFCVGFLKKHGLIFEEFLICQAKLGVKSELVLFPSTRFAYLFLMCFRVLLNLSAMRLVAESPTYALVKSLTKKRGEEGKKALAEFKRFESLVEARAFRIRLLGTVSIMEPFSIALHYCEGDSVPLSHIFPVFQLVYDFSQQVDDFEAVTEFMTEEEERDAVADRVRKRWLGESRKVGLKADVHLLAFVLDPFAQATTSSAEKPDCDLLSGDVIEAARAALRHFSSDDHAKRSVLLQQLMLWNAAAPRLPGEGAAGGSADSKPKAQATGNNAFSRLRLDAMTQVWDKIKARDDKLQEDTTIQRDNDSSSFKMKESLAKLRLCSSPVDFWLAMMNEQPRGANAEQKAAHMLFCKSASDISSIVGHTCGVERAGKAYKQVLGPLRKSMDPVRAMKAIFVFSNYNLSEHKQTAGDAFSAFRQEQDPAGDQERAGVEKDPYQRNTLRRGNLIFNDVTGEGSDESGDETNGEEGEEGEGGGVTEVKWYLPSKFEVAPEPARLDSSLVGEIVFMRWETYGWQVGKITDIITQRTPQLFKKFNFRVVWADKSKGPCKLAVESYAFGESARLNSWVMLHAKVQGEES